MPQNKGLRATYLSDEYRNSLGRLLDLTDDQKSKLKKVVHKEIAAWKQDSSGLQDKLSRWNDLVENVVEETDYPFEGASNLHVPLIAIYMKVYHSILRRSVLATGKIWYCESEDERLSDALPMIEENLNYKAMSKWNIGEALSEVFWTTPRDGLGIVQISHVEEYETNVKDFVLVHNDAQFLEEFPQDDSGMSAEEWQRMREQVATEATEETPVEIPITYDKQVYFGPKAEVVEYADFVIFPATARDIGLEYARGYGKRFYMRRGQIKRKKAEGVWYEDAVKSFLSKTKKGSRVTGYHSAKDEIEGLARSQKSDDYEFYELVYRMELERGKGEQKILLTYHFDTKELMAAIAYPYRVDFYALFRVRKKANRLAGGSVAGDLEDVNEEIDTLHNQRINSRKISEVPSFKAKKDAKKDFDPEAEQNRWRPGVIFWLEDPDSFDQFKVQPTDLGTSMQEEQNDIHIASMDAGVDPGLMSGLPQRDNPKAPGNKTALLIQQANMRMDDPLNEIRDGIERVGEICLSHEYQFGPAHIQFMSKNDATAKREMKSFPKRILRMGIDVKMHGITVTLNPEAEFQKWLQYYQVLTRDPMIAKRNKSRWHLLMNAMRSGRVHDREKILPTLEELQKEEIEMRKQAMMQMQQEQQAQAAKAQEEKKKALIGKVREVQQARAMKIKAAKQEQDLLALNGNPI